MKTINYYSLILIMTSLSYQLSYADNCLPWRSEFASRSNLLIGQIDIGANGIFDLKNSKENGSIHRLANKIHIQTKPSVIKKQLLFTEGDFFKQKKLDDSERSLRKQRYIKSASVTPYMLCGNQVKIRVTTYDNWTLTPGVTFSRKGGNNNSGIKIQEHNLLGLGKSLSFTYKMNSKRNSKLFYYKDPQLLGTRNSFSLNLQDNTDGKGYEVKLERPFIELDSKYSWGLNTSKLKQANPIFKAGLNVNNITEEKQNHSVFYGWLTPPLKTKENNNVLRFKVGWTFDKTSLLASSNNPQFQKINIQESYPWVEFNSLQEHFIKKTNFKTMGKIEDIPLGESITVGLGLLNKSLGSDDNQLKISAEYSKGYLLNENNLGFLSIQSTSYIGSGGRQGNQVSFKSEINHFNKTGNDYSLRTDVKIADNLTISEQLVMGGEKGLRAYPTAFQTGNKSILVQAEKLVHFEWYPLRLFKFGGVFFADAGTAWGNGNSPKLMADIGIGLRLYPTRSSSGSTVHFNLAMPLTERNKVEKYQFSIGTTKAFQ